MEEVAFMEGKLLMVLRFWLIVEQRLDDLRQTKTLSAPCVMRTTIGRCELHTFFGGSIAIADFGVIEI